MCSDENNQSDLKSRLFYGAVIGAVIGMIIGTMPGNGPLIGVISMAFGAAVISFLAVFSKSFWESLCAAWELVRISFWRW